MKILETRRLLLRRQLLTDLDALYKIYQDPDVVRFIPDAPSSLAETLEEIEWFLHGHPKRPELGLWATIHKQTSQLIGRCGLLPWTIEEREEVEVAYLLAKAYWGQGLGTEVAQAIADYGETELQLSRLVCMIYPQNHASQKVARKIGMTLEKEIEDDLGPYLLYAKSK